MLTLLFPANHDYAAPFRAHPEIAIVRTVNVKPRPKPVVKAPVVVTVSVAGLSSAQTDNARLIVQEGESLGVPVYGQQIAVATAMQESTLYNIDYGTSDSVGLFQQQADCGWGTKTEIMNPWYSAKAFYEALLDVPGWQHMELTIAAQSVQKSAYPYAYQKWSGLAQQVVGALGN